MVSAVGARWHKQGAMSDVRLCCLHGMLFCMLHPRNTRGLLLRKGVWHIDKVLFGRRRCESTRTGDLAEGGDAAREPGERGEKGASLR